MHILIIPHDVVRVVVLCANSLVCDDILVANHCITSLAALVPTGSAAVNQLLLAQRQQALCFYEIRALNGTRRPERPARLMIMRQRSDFRPLRPANDLSDPQVSGRGYGDARRSVPGSSPGSRRLTYANPPLRWQPACPTLAHGAYRATELAVQRSASTPPISQQKYAQCGVLPATILRWHIVCWYITRRTLRDNLRQVWRGQGEAG